jgi:hypothetical protein
MLGVLRVLLRRSRAEEGSFLVEAVASAALLLVLAGGVILAFDAAGAQSGQQRNVAQAASLAQAEMERLHALPFTTLAALDETAHRTVGSVRYRIHSKASEGLVPAPAGNACETSGRSAEAVKVTTTVTWEHMGNRKPVVLTSLIAAPVGAHASRGALVVQVVDRFGHGVQGLLVLFDGDVDVSGITDVNGCVRFSDLAAQSGARIRFHRSGWQTPQGVSEVDDPVDIIAGVTQTRSYQYDPIGQVTATFVYRIGSGAEQPVAMPGWTWVNNTTLVTDSADPPRDTVTSPPFPAATSQIGIYPDTCPAARPPQGNPPPSPWSAPPGGTVRVQVPAIDVNLQGGADESVTVHVRTACGTIMGPYHPTRVGSQWRVRTGLPYGEISLCLRRGGSSPRQIEVVGNRNDTWPHTAINVNLNSNPPWVVERPLSVETCGW